MVGDRRCGQRRHGVGQMAGRAFVRDDKGGIQGEARGEHQEQKRDVQGGENSSPFKENER